MSISGVPKNFKLSLKMCLKITFSLFKITSRNSLRKSLDKFKIFLRSNNSLVRLFISLRQKMLWASVHHKSLRQAKPKKAFANFWGWSLEPAVGVKNMSFNLET